MKTEGVSVTPRLFALCDVLISSSAKLNFWENFDRAALNVGANSLHAPHMGAEMQSTVGLSLALASLQLMAMTPATTENIKTKLTIIFFI